MWPLGVVFVLFGYALSYTGASNILNGGSGPRLWQSLGFQNPIGSPGATGSGGDGRVVIPGSGGQITVEDSGYLPKVDTPIIEWDPGIDWVGPGGWFPKIRLPNITLPGTPFI